VAIALNLRQPQVTEFYREHWKLKGLYMLDQIYEEMKGNIGSFVNLYGLAKTAGMNVSHVNRLLMIANNDLPSVESRYEGLKKEAATLEFQKASSARDSELLNNQIIMMHKTLDSTHLDCEKELERLRHLQQQRMNHEALVKHFENSNEVYIKIRKTVEEKVISILSNSKMLLKLALLSLTESMRKDPDKFNAFIFCDNKSLSSTTQTRSYSQYYDTVPYGQQQYPSQDYIDVLLEEAEKLYNKLAKELVDESISDYAYNILSSLPLLPPAKEEQQSHPRQTTAANQSYVHTEKHKFIRSEIDNDG
jgi:hypothetical protein